MGLATGVTWELFKEPSFVSQKILIDGKLNFLGKITAGVFSVGAVREGVLKSPEHFFTVKSLSLPNKETF